MQNQIVKKLFVGLQFLRRQMNQQPSEADSQTNNPHAIQHNKQTNKMIQISNESDINHNNGYKY